MKTPASPFGRRALRRTTSLIAACLLGAAFAFAPVLRADDAKPKTSESAKALPLTATFAKDANAEGAPFILTLKNVSDQSVKVSGKILLAVAFHADNKAKKLAEHTIDAGKEWSIPGLAAQDKVILHAEGYAPLEIVVQ